MTVEQSDNPAATLRQITAAAEQILDRIERKLQPETERQRLQRYLSQCEECLGQIGETESADLMHTAFNALWDLVLEHQFQQRRLTGC